MPREVRGFEGGYILNEYQDAPLKGDEVLVKSEFGSAKHGTELAHLRRGGVDRGRYDKEWQMFLKPGQGSIPVVTPVPAPAPTGEKKLGGRVGNMIVGTVVEVGPEAKMLKKGDRVCTHVGFRETVVRSEKGFTRIPKDLSWKSAVCLDPADFALGAVRDGNVRVGDAVSIFGLGAIGLMAVQLCRESGAYPIIAVDLVKSRCDLALRMGAHLAFDPTKCDVGYEIKKATEKRGTDVTIEYSGNVQAMQAAIRGTAYRGTVVAGAFPGPYPAGLDLGAEAHLNIPNIVFSRSCSEPNRDYPRWSEKRILDVCLRMFIEGTLSGDEVVTPVVDLQDVPTEYPKIATELEKYVKLGVKF